MTLYAWPSYDSYKGSGIDWIGQIPTHWEQRANKYIFRLSKTLVGKRSTEYELLSLTLQGIIKRDMDNPEGKFPAEFDTYQEVNPGDFVFCHFDVEETPRTVGLSEFFGMITGAYTVYSVSDSIDPRFLLHFYICADTDKKMRSLYKGLRNTIPKEAFGAFKTPLPPIEEQRGIVAFLDEASRKIEDAIAIKEEQIALLRERRQILIQQAVTRGLNPDAPMKDSGVNWIGQMPAHWGLVPLRRVSRIHAGNGFPVELQGDDGGTIPFMKVSDFSSTTMRISSANNYVSEKTIRSRKWNKVPKGSIVTAKIGEALRKNHRNVLEVDAIIDNNCVGFEPVEMRQAYFFWVHKVIDFEWFVNPGAVPSISMSKYKSEKVPNPPLSEQVEIAGHIEAGCEKIDRAISVKEEQIAALKEYKTTLINAAVTGKIKVA